MGLIISIVSFKGGTSKSSSVINLAYLLAHTYKKKVLCIDADAQANMTQGFGVSDELNKNMYTLIRKQHTVDEVIIKKVKDMLDIIPSNLDLTMADPELAGRPARELVLSKILEPIKPLYDLILIDCPPNMGVVATNAICASDYYLIPLQAEVFALRGLQNVGGMIGEVKDSLKLPVDLLGVFLTRYNKQKVLSRTVAAHAKEQLNDKLFDSYIRENVAIAEAQLDGLSVFEHDPLSKGAEDYAQLCKELVERLNKISNGKK